jgi:colicin import membrane protein
MENNMMQKKMISLLVAAACGAGMGSAMAADAGATVSVNAGGVTAQQQVEVRTDGLQNSSTQLQQNLGAKAAQAEQGLTKAVDAHAAAAAKVEGVKAEGKADAGKAHAHGHAATGNPVADVEAKAKEKAEKAKADARDEVAKAHEHGKSAADSAEDKVKDKADKAKEQARSEEGKAKSHDHKQKTNHASSKAKRWKKGHEKRAAKAVERAKADAAAVSGGAGANASVQGSTAAQ